MKKFTLKDFIYYNSPCFSCGQPINVSFISTETKDKWAPSAFLRPTVREEYTTVNLKLTYMNALQLQVIHKSNRFASTNSEELANYLLEHNLLIKTDCNKCLTYIESQFLEFNMNKGFILPVGIGTENVILTDDTHRYHIYSSFFSERSVITADRIDKPFPVQAMRLEAPLMPLFKFRDRDHLINKLKTYMLFS